MSHRLLLTITGRARRIAAAVDERTAELQQRSAELQTEAAQRQRTPVPRPPTTLRRSPHPMHARRMVRPTPGLRRVVVLSLDLLTLPTSTPCHRWPGRPRR